MQLKLIRSYGDLATTGKLLVDTATFFSIEQPWRDNLKGHSCVPEGDYVLLPYLSPKHGATWCLHNPALNIYGTVPVPEGGRDGCEIHSANWAEQLEGCIALGLAGQPMFDPLTGAVEPAIEESVSAITQLHELIGAMTSGHTLQILSA